MALWKDVQEYLDDNGLVLPKKNVPGQFPETGNGIAYSSLLAYQLKKNGEWNLETRKWFDDAIRSCQVPGLKGLYNRAPEKDEQNGCDDYVMLCAVSHALDMPFSREVVARGKRNGWMFKNKNIGSCDLREADTWKSWFGRNVAAVAHFLWCTNEKPSFVGRIVWSLVIGFTGIIDNSNTSKWVLSNFMVAEMDGRSWVGTLASVFWLRRFKKVFKGGMQEASAKWMAKEDGSLNWEHPIVRHWKD